MDLSSNTITGEVPNSLGSLSYLELFLLHNNKFDGNLPAALQNLTSLVIFDLGNNLLTGNIPSWIGKKLFELRFLNLRSNKFMGKIPLDLCQNNALQYLSLANNSITGMIPRCFYKLTGMIMNSFNFVYKYTDYEESIETYIKGIQLEYTSRVGFLTSLDLSGNKIFGEIPDALTNLTALTNLNLSRNLLSGQIPAKIGNLKQMESLDISMNMLSGQIPPGFATLNSLGYLNLSFNNLSGQIPFGNHLQTLGDPSDIYEGNNMLLCGHTPLRSCKWNNTHVGETEALPALSCQVNNGDCWKSTREGRNYSACIDGNTNGCTCPPGFRGDGVSSCEDIDECKEKTACQCSQCKCKNTWGSYECSHIGKKKRVVFALSISAGLAMLCLISALYIWSKRKWRSDTVREGRTVKVLDKDHNSSSKNGSNELAVFSLSRISKATDNFSITNQLGEGGFGPVYKGLLEEGLEIAVKRLSKSSRQGLDEFENEVKCIAKLQHRNLVKLLGYCIQRDENMLVYEYMHNKSLDWFIFDDLRKSLLDWPQRFHIINGIARGLLYLHQDSRLRVVHRDLKAGNILLDHDLNPKISDFGLARMFKGHENEANPREWWERWATYLQSMQ